MAGFPPLPSGWQNCPNLFVGIPKRKDPRRGKGKGARVLAYSELECGAPTDSPASGWGCPGAVKPPGVDSRVTECPSSCLTAGDPRRAASAARPCPSTALPHNWPPWSSVTGFPSLTIARGFQQCFPPAACCLLFPAHPLRSLLSLQPFASFSASSAAWGPGRTDSFKLQPCVQP